MAKRKLYVDAHVVATLELAREKLAALLDPYAEDCRVGATDGLSESGPRCECCGAGISDHTIKDAIRAYVQLWTVFPFDTALARIKGEATDGERAYLEAVAAGLSA
ncbi:MAG TPA: hypothetical protein VJT84_11285 [Gaiellaceae bacterium]|nr:hypothetical protein [Gaiellaceae bacterium]